MANKLRNKKTLLANVVLCFMLLLVQMTMADRSRKDIEKLLKKLNKPAVKSIKMRPSSYPEEIKFEETNMAQKSAPIAQRWQQSGSCPEGTIPIRRTTEEDIFRANSIQKVGEKNLQTSRLPSYVGVGGGRRVNELAAVFVKGDKYYGGKGTMNVWNPKVQQDDEWTFSAIWVLNDADEKNMNAIEAGWQVNPYIYGDYQTRLFTFWTNDNIKSTGCYDLRCSGFVQLNAGIAVGSAIKPLSVYNNTNSQYDITIMIWKDKSNGDWWMQYGADKVMGYWPSSLFSHLSDSATIIRWGGQVVNSATNGKHTTTQMGSGKFPGERYGKASYFKNIKFVNPQNQMVPADNTFPQADRPDCYNVQSGHSNDPGWARFFYFGGPGSNPKCP